MVCIIINGNSLPHSDELVNELLEIEGMTSISLNVNNKKNSGNETTADTIGFVRTIKSFLHFAHSCFALILTILYENSSLQNGHFKVILNSFISFS